MFENEDPTKQQPVTVQPNATDVSGQAGSGGEIATSANGETATTDPAQQTGGVANAGVTPAPAQEGNGVAPGAPVGTATPDNATVVPAPTTQEQPAVPEQSAYTGPDWSGGFGAGMQKGGVGYQMTGIDAWHSYNDWAKANGKDALDPIDWYMYSQKHDLDKSPEQQAAEEKKARRQERWEKIGNVLSHLGNFVGTLTGAPSQQIESAEALTKRQQALRDLTIKQRGDTANNFLAQIWKQRADARQKELNAAKKGAEDALARQRQADADQTAALTPEKVATEQASQKQKLAAAGASDASAAASKAQRDYTEGKNKREEKKLPYQIATEKARANAGNASAEASRASAGRSRAETRKANTEYYGKKYEKDRYVILARNKRKHPQLTQDFMKRNNIHSYDKKNWKKELIDEYNAEVADFEANSKRSSGGNASGLLD